MEKLKNIFSQRLKNARIMRNMSMENLAKACNNIVSKQSISKYENAIMLPDSTVCIALAKALDISIEDLFRPIKFNIEGVEFRKKMSLGKKKIEAIKKIVENRIESYIEIEDILNILPSRPHKQYQVNKAEDVYSIANKIKQEWKLGQNAISNVITQLEEHNIKVIEIDVESNFDGLTALADNQYYIIVLNKRFPEERKRFTALHELGHIIMKFQDDISDKQKEYMCNLFASEMLISKEKFIQIIGQNRQNISINELREIQKRFGISIDALMYKAKHESVISENKYRNFCIYFLK